MDGSQALAASYRYDPFGNTISSSGTQRSANVYRFASKEIHLNSGMYCYGYRFYDPNLQRWLNRDPLDDKSGLATVSDTEDLPVGEILFGQNLYQFVYNDPVLLVDAYGLYTPSEWLTIVGAGFTGAGQGVAAAGDGAIPFFNPLSGLYDPSDPVFKFSRHMGTVASLALDGAGALKAGGIATRIGLHGPHHRFPRLGGKKLPHLQLNWWRPGVKGSGGSCRIPLPGKTK